LDPAILRQSFFGNIEVRADLYLVDQLGIIGFIDGEPFDQMAIDANADARPFFVHFDVNIGASEVIGIADNAVDEIDLRIENQLLFLVRFAEMTAEISLNGNSIDRLQLDRTAKQRRQFLLYQHEVLLLIDVELHELRRNDFRNDAVMPGQIRSDRLLQFS
jgi:hypothetical protein